MNLRTVSRKASCSALNSVLLIMGGISVGLRKLETLLGDEGQDQLLGDRRDARHSDFAEQALDVVLLCVAEPAVREDRAFAGLVAGAGAEELGGVGLGATRLVLVV